MKINYCVNLYNVTLIKKENKEPPCCGNCISFTDEDAFGEGLCCDKEGGTVCWEWCNKHKYR